MKIKEWVIEANHLIYGPFKISGEAIKYAKKKLNYGWKVRPVWEPLN